MNYFKVLVLSLLIGVLGFITIYSLGEKNTKHNRTIKFENKINTVGYNDKLRSGADSELINIQCEKEKKIIVLIGQSLAGNNGPIVEKIKKSGTNFYNFNCYEMLNYAYGTGPEQSNAKLRENISYYISKKLINSDEFIWITAAWDGTSVIEWGMEDSYLSNYTNKQIRSLIENHGATLKYIIWMQGEADNGYTHTFSYEEYFNNSIENLLEDINEENYHIIITSSSRCGDADVDYQLNSIHKSLGLKKNIHTLDVTDSIGNKFRIDNCHLNEMGLEKASDEISSKINQIEIEQ